MQIVIGHLNPADSPYQYGAVIFKTILEQMTKRKITVRIIPDIDLSGSQLIEEVRKGKLDIGITASGPLGKIVPESNAFDFPYLFRNREHAYRVLDGEIGAYVNRKMERVGLKNLAWWENGFRHITTSNKPIRKPDDLRGLKFRTLDNQVQETLFRLWGTQTLSVPFSKLYEALKRGTVEGEENPLGILIPNQFYEVQHYLILTGHYYSPALFVMNKAVYDRFSLVTKKKILHAAKIARDYERNFLKRNNPVYLQIARNNGMRILRKKDIDLPAFIRTSRKVYTLLGKPFASIHRKIRSL